MKRVAEQIADWLVDQGIEQVFCVTGGGSMFINYALGNHPKLKCTFMHHEQACSMAAEGYARVTNKPAVVMVTTGPGSINAMNGVYGAFTDSIPMIVLSGQVKSETCLDFHDLPNLRQLGDQEGPTIAMATPITKYAKLVRKPGDIETMLPEAYYQSVTGRPGPVWLDIPLDIQSSTEQLAIGVNHSFNHSISDTLETECKYLIDKIKTAKRPLILAGTGVRLAGAKDRLIKFIERTGIPIATAWTHDLIASDHPLFAGRPGSIGTRAGNFCLQSADLVIVLGSRLNIRQTGYNWKAFAKDAWLAQVDVDPAELNKPTVKPTQPIVADINDFLDVMENLLETRPISDYTNWVNWCQEIGNKFDVMKEHQQDIGQALNPYVVVDRIINQLRDDDVIVCGNASACILPFQVAKLKSNQRLFSNSGSASMGHDLPTAIGASTATKRVICFAGDGSLQMNIQELQTLKTAGTNVIIIVLNNRGYLSIRQTHENFFGKIIGATPDSGVDFPDFVKVANAYGIDAHCISTEKNNIRDLDNLLELDGPLLIDIMVNPLQNFAPRMKARLDENGNFVPLFLDDMFPFLEDGEVDRIRNSAKTI